MLVKDMFDKNGHNPSCGFAGDIVSYLYDEIDPAEKLKFEMHLANCATCGTELAAFSDVRTSMINWREADFGWLPSPDIVIPYEKLPEQPLVVETRGTILTDLRRLFSFSPWPPAFAAFGALAIIAGLAFLGISYLNEPEKNVADNRNTSQPVVSPTIKVQPSETTVASDDPPAKQKTRDEVVNAQKSTATEPVKISTPTAQPKKAVQPAYVAPNKSVEKNTTTQKAPSLNNYAIEEDNTLRLADLFEEIDTRK